MNRRHLVATITVLAVTGMAGCSSKPPPSSAGSAIVASSERAGATDSTPTSSTPPLDVNTATTCLLLPATTLPGQPFEAVVGCQGPGEASFTGPPPGVSCATTARGEVRCSKPHDSGTIVGGTATTAVGPLNAGFECKVDYETTGPTSCPARAVHLTDRSTGNPIEWSWRFPDGSTSSERSPVYMARSDGILKAGEVALVVSDGTHSDEMRKTLQIVDC